MKKGQVTSINSGNNVSVDGMSRLILGIHLLINLSSSISSLNDSKVDDGYKKDDDGGHDEVLGKSQCN